MRLNVKLILTTRKNMILRFPEMSGYNKGKQRTQNDLDIAVIQSPLDQIMVRKEEDNKEQEDYRVTLPKSSSDNPPKREAL